MKIYLAGSMVGGRKFEKGLKSISDTLEKMGHVVMTKNNVVANELKNNPPNTLSIRRYKMKRDKRWIKNCDAFIAEVSTYSHGVGYEHAYAESLGKPVLLLRSKSLIKNYYSAFLDGTDYKIFMFSFYDKKSVNRILKKFFAKFF